MSSILAVIFCLAVVLGSFGLYLQDKQAEASLAMESARRQLTLAKNALADRDQHLSLLKRHYDIQRSIYDTNQAYIEAATVMQELEQEIDSQKKTYQHIVEARRNSARGTTLEFLELPDGTVLRSAKILNFDDTTLSVLTPSGILKIPAQELPDHLKDYFRLDLIEPESELAAGALDPENSTGETPKGAFQYSNISMEPSSGEPTLSHNEKVKLYSQHLQVLSTRISKLEQAKNAPFIGIDSYLKPGSAAHKHRLRDRAKKLDREIAVLAARRRELEAQRRKLTAPAVTNR